MDDYQDLAPQVGADIGSVPLGHSRYAVQQSQYASSSYPQGAMAHGQAPSATVGASGGMPVAGYEWNAYAAHSQDTYMHPALTRAQPAAPSKSTTQPLRNKVSERLQQIDREAFETEERRYQQKGEEIQSEIMLILRGTHPVFAEGVARLAAERDRLAASAEQNHQYLIGLYEKAYRQEREQAEQAYKSEKQAIYEKIAADIEERRKRLKEEKDSLDINMDFVFDSGSRAASKRNLRKRGLDPLGLGDPIATTSRHQNKRKNAQAFSMQGVAEDDIVSDLLAIRRATGVTGPLSTAANGKKSGKGNKR
ncbi:hypothetical protein GGI25_004862 [Coemansia spiralis]|uniref:Uncharacterized protein n=2 Tax=Coemansia TaxID=4863 RepID=A0A9W8FZM1_9FUNG|nr:Sds3-like-domain-containing protein [Coemansia spiralis]KAJ1991931.1 hypothetical protein EDC05_003085 [Coemansia umbellata]KAJ2625302.1 hypothetical protein GGI26_000772 [Coemansia sp. RSA 1358]KAJ2673047.1 hypothetical protein GGI25_004862 [Coemansia spiralis]